MVVVIPVVEAVGAGEPQGKAKTCHDVAVPGLVQPRFTDDDNKAVVVKPIGCAHAGGGPHVIFAAHPVEVVVAFDVNTKVKQPFALLEIIAGGKVVPEYVPTSVPVISFPLYTLKISDPACVLNAVKVTVTTSPGVTGHIVVVIFSLLP